MAHPPRGLLFRLARLLEPPALQDVNDALLSAAFVPGARHLTPLLLLVERDVSDRFAETFTKGAALDDRPQVAAILREIATCGETHGGSCRCVVLARAIGPFAYALTGVDDPFYSRIGEIVLDDVVLALDPAADPRTVVPRSPWPRSDARAGADPS